MRKRIFITPNSTLSGMQLRLNSATPPPPNNQVAVSLRVLGYNDTSWVNNITRAINPSSVSRQAISFTFRNTAGNLKYRVLGVANETVNANGTIQKKVLVSNSTCHLRFYPKTLCSVDTDNDGITNNKDVDNNGDGCPSATEASANTKSNVAAGNGMIKNGIAGSIPYRISNVVIKNSIYTIFFNPSVYSVL